MTPSDTYDKAAEKEATELIKSIDFVYAERVDMAMTDYFQVLTPERWKNISAVMKQPKPKMVDIN